MADPDYDPVKRRERYLRNRQLKGRRKGTPELVKPATTKPNLVADQESKQRQRVVRLSRKLSRLRKAKKEAQKALREAEKREQEQRSNARKQEKQGSDGKTTAKERQASKEYRDRNRSKVERASKESSSKSKSTEDMSSDELKDRVKNITDLIKKTRKQLEKVNSTPALSQSETFADNYLVHDGRFGR